QGGFSEIWDAHDRKLDTRVAVKIFRYHSYWEGQEQMFSRVLEVQGKFLHPVILPIVDFGTHDGNRFVVMPLIRDSKTLDSADLSPMVKLRLVRDLAYAVHAVHEGGYHRFDVKPSNVLVSQHPDQPACAYWTDLDLAISIRDPFQNGHL